MMQFCEGRKCLGGSQDRLLVKILLDSGKFVMMRTVVSG